MAKKKKKIGRIYKHAKQRRETQKLNKLNPQPVKCDEHNYCAKGQTAESSGIDSQPNLANNDHCEEPTNTTPNQNVLYPDISPHTSQNVYFPLGPNHTTDKDRSEHPVIAIPHQYVLYPHISPHTTFQNVYFPLGPYHTTDNDRSEHSAIAIPDQSVLCLNIGPSTTSQTATQNLQSTNATLPQPATTCSDNDDNVDIINIFKALKNDEEFPQNWSVTVSNSVLQLCMLATGFHPMIQRWITMDTDRVVAACVHGKELPRDHAFWGNVSDITGNDCFLIAKQLLSIVKCMCGFKVCCGNFEKVYQNVFDPTQVLPHSKKVGYVEQNYMELGYEGTIRSAECRLLVSNKERCVPCKNQRKSLQTKLSRNNQRTDSSVSLSRPHSSIPSSLLLAHLKQYSQKTTHLRNQVNVLKRKIAKMTQATPQTRNENEMSPPAETTAK